MKRKESWFLKVAPGSRRAFFRGEKGGQGCRRARAAGLGGGRGTEASADIDYQSASRPRSEWREIDGGKRGGILLGPLPLPLID